MSEARRPVRTVKVVYVCDECGEGEMERPPAHTTGRFIDLAGCETHVCTHCGNTQVFIGKTYPRIKHEVIDDA